MRSPPDIPMAWLAVVLVTALVFWGGVALLAVKVFRLSVPTPASAVAAMPGRS